MAESKMVKQWFKYAIHDLKVAKNSLAASNEFKNIAAFHAQQCAEKAIKGFLAFHKIRVHKTHMLGDLAKEVMKVDKVLAELILKSKDLSKYAVIYRYPDAERKPLTLAKAKNSIKKSEKIYQECFKRIYETLAIEKSDKIRKTQKNIFRKLAES